MNGNEGYARSLLNILDLFASDILSKKNQNLRTEISELKFLIENNFKNKN
jgi:hypothetical protein